MRKAEEQAEPARQGVPRLSLGTRRRPLVTIQETLVLLVAAAAVLYLGRAAWRTLAGSGCEKGCGCGPKREEGPKLIAVEELLVRVRRGDEAGARKEPKDDC